MMYQSIEEQGIGYVRTQLMGQGVFPVGLDPLPGYFEMWIAEDNPFLLDAIAEAGFDVIHDETDDGWSYVEFSAPPPRFEEGDRIIAELDGKLRLGRVVEMEPDFIESRRHLVILDDGTRAYFHEGTMDVVTLWV